MKKLKAKQNFTTMIFQTANNVTTIGIKQLEQMEM
jgi:hypothetical protein